MKYAIPVAAALLMVCSFASQAGANGTVVLTFEGLQDFEPILEYYNGGLGGLGSGPGPDYGVSFAPDFQALIAESAGGAGTFESNPSGDTIALIFTDTGSTMNVPAGFDTGFSFFYSAPGSSGIVSINDGLDGTGNFLASLDLPVTPIIGGIRVDNWQPIGVGFAGTAKSVVFVGATVGIGFDNITLGASQPVGAVPEPITMVLTLAGVAGLGGYLRRRTAA